ncbi:MAG: hypothetical protein HYY55_00370 [Candidatus Niyogibacteria bacterium]|nr:MAG: hypothetical protein HYY55_00370 [Candidatus Niyogibacteria bacterium]
MNPVKKKLVLYASICGAVLLLFFFGKFIEPGAASFLFKKIESIKALGSAPISYYNFWGLFKYKSEILRQNQELAERLTALESREMVLKFSGLFENSADFMEATVILRPPAIEYGQLIVSKGLSDGVTEGKIVLLGDSVIVGAVGEVFSGSSRVISYSDYGREQNVFLEQAGISASAVGQGNNELEITLPRDFPVYAGDRAFSLTDPPYLVGLVERVESSASSPVKTLKIKQPFNIHNIYSVRILK